MSAVDSRVPLGEVQHNTPRGNTFGVPPKSPVPCSPSPMKLKSASNKSDLFRSPLKKVDPEPLTDPSSDRYTMFPIKYQSIWEFYKKAEASFWTGDHMGVFPPT